MGLETVDIVHAVIIGLLATAMLDLWTLFLARVFRVSSLNYCLLGRWLGHMPAGILRHQNIAASPQTSAECSIGWTAHYLTGVLFAVALLLMVKGQWLAQPTFLPALALGIVTVLFPFLLMQPCFGLGIAASKTPKPNQARLKSLLTHAVFGTGLYLAARLLQALGLFSG